MTPKPSFRSVALCGAVVSVCDTKCQRITAARLGNSCRFHPVSWPLAPGHLLAMLLGILPVALLVTIIEWQREIVPDSEVVRFEVALSGLVPVA